MGRAERRYAGVTHINVDQLDQQAAMEIQQQFQQAGVSISGLGYYPNPLSPDSEEAETAVAQIRRVIEAALPDLKVISRYGVGLDNIDIAEATKREILVGYTPGVLAKSTADLAFALLLAVARRVVESDKWVREGNWKISHHPMFWLGSEVNGSTLGVLGLGGIGMETAKRALGFDMKVLYHSRTRKPEVEKEYGFKYASFKRVLAESDFISIHVPLTPETHGCLLYTSPSPRD